MRYLICSDIHGDDEAFKRILKLRREHQCSRIISAGDFCPDSEMEYLASMDEFATVSGNCDRWHGYTILPDPRPVIEFSIGGHRVVVAHGDRSMPGTYNMKKGDIFISGHTHVPVLAKDSSGVILLNPGSPSRPRSMEGPTYIVMDEKEATLFSFLDSAPLRKIDY